MTFGALARSIARYLRVEDDDITYEIKDLINEAILEFLRSDSWAKTEVQKTLTLDDSDSYLLSSFIVPGTDPAFYNERNLSLAQSDDTEVVSAMEKVTQFRYSTSSDKRLLWAIDATTLYIKGDNADVVLFYNSAGIIDQFVIDTDETETNLVLTYYADVIKKWVVWKWQVEYGDDESALKEQNSLKFKIQELKAHENRVRKQGASVTISAHNR